MDRLTKKTPGVPAVPVNINLDFVFDLNDKTWSGLSAIFERLAEYEDTGLSPKQINSLQAGALRSDKTMHKAYSTALGRRHYGATCPHCGGLLGVAYHEDRLYSVKCDKCENLTLVEARNPCDAQYKAGGIRKEPPGTMQL